MPSVTVSSWGKCLAIRIPKQVIDGMKMKAGDQVEYSLNEGNLTFKKVRKVKKYNLAELLDGAENMPREDVVDWGEPVGREVW